MGLYDEVRIDMPLPPEHRAEWQTHRFQTKQLDCMLDLFVIREDGTMERSASPLHGLPAEHIGPDHDLYQQQVRVYGRNEAGTKWLDVDLLFHEGRVIAIGCKESPLDGEKGY